MGVGKIRSEDFDVAQIMTSVVLDPFETPDVVVSGAATSPTVLMSLAVVVGVSGPFLARLTAHSSFGQYLSTTARDWEPRRSIAAHRYTVCTAN